MKCEAVGVDPLHREMCVLGATGVPCNEEAVTVWEGKWLCALHHGEPPSLTVHEELERAEEVLHQISKRYSNYGSIHEIETFELIEQYFRGRHSRRISR